MSTMAASRDPSPRNDARPSDRPTVLIWHRRAHRYAELLRARLPEVRIDATTDAPDGATAARAEALLTWQPPPGALDRLPALRWLHLAGAGADHLLRREDLGADVVVTKSRGRFGSQAAEYVLGWLLHLLLRIDDYEADRSRRDWQPRPRPLLVDRTVGLLGLGSIGRAVARTLHGVGATVVGSCRRPRHVHGVDTVFPADRWRRMLPRCDALVLALPLTERTTGMIDARALATLPDDAILVNLARGALVRQAPLVAALRAGRLRAAVLDVFEQEPLPPDHPLWREPRARITPHVAAPSEPAVIAGEFATHYETFAAGGTPEPRVDRDLGY